MRGRLTSGLPSSRLLFAFCVLSEWLLGLATTSQVSYRLVGHLGSTCLGPYGFIWIPFCPDLDQAMPSRTCPVAYKTVRHWISSRGTTRSTTSGPSRTYKWRTKSYAIFRQHVAWHRLAARDRASRGRGQLALGPYAWSSQALSQEGKAGGRQRRCG